MENQIETKISEELGLILAQSYEQLFANRENIRIITQELDARMKRHQEVEKEIADGATDKQ